jgi:predicted amidohydrolase YtcJ
LHCIAPLLNADDDLSSPEDRAANVLDFAGSALRPPLADSHAHP